MLPVEVALDFCDELIEASHKYLIRMKDDDLKAVDMKLSQLVGRLPTEAIRLQYAFIRHRDLKFDPDKIRLRKNHYHSIQLDYYLRLLKIPVIKLKVQALNDIQEMIRGTERLEQRETEAADSKAKDVLFPVDTAYSSSY